MTKDQRKRADIAEFTHRGDENRSKNDFTNAIKNYKKAYNLSREINDDNIERLCALNLGAACIGADDAKEGLSYLHKATPPDNVRDEPSNGALFFNKGLGYEKLGDSKNALENFKLAYEEYKEYERYDTDVLLHCLEKCLTTYEKQGDHLKAADVCKELAHLFDGLSKVTKLCERVNHLRLGESFEDSRKETLGLLETVVKMDLEGDECLEAAKILNDIGLAFTLVHSYDDAKVSFEKALERLLDSHIPQLQLEAVLRQNLGASYNFLGEYDRAVHFHEEAIDRYGKTNNRNSQGQCFTNLAYALTQQGDLKQAEVAFHQALRAAKDTEDTHMEWQALEGLGAVNFSQSDYKSAVDFYVKALQTINQLEPASERIKKKFLQAHQKLLGVRPNEPILTDRSLRDLQIHPLLFEEHAQVGATPRENYKSLTAEIFTSEPPMMVKVEDPPPKNMVVTVEDKQMMVQVSQDKNRKRFVQVRKKDSIGPHLPKISRGIGSSLGFYETQSPRRSLHYSQPPRLEEGPEETSEDSSSSSEDDDSTDSDDNSTECEKDENIQTQDKLTYTKSQTMESTKMKEIFRKTTLEDTIDNADDSLQKYQEQLKEKEARDDIEESSEESSDSSESLESSDTSDSCDSDDNFDDMPKPPKPGPSRTNDPPPLPTQSPPNTSQLGQQDHSTYLKPQSQQITADVHSSVSSSRVAGQQDSEAKSPRQSDESIEDETEGGANGNVDDVDATDPKTLYSTVDKTQQMKTQQAQAESEKEDPYDSLKFKRTEGDNGEDKQRTEGDNGEDKQVSDDSSDDETPLDKMPRGKREQLLSQYHREHEMSHGSKSDPPPLPARSSSKGDKNETSSSKTCSIM